MKTVRHFGLPILFVICGLGLIGWYFWEQQGSAVPVAQVVATDVPATVTNVPVVVTATPTPISVTETALPTKMPASATPIPNTATARPTRTPLKTASPTRTVVRPTNTVAPTAINATATLRMATATRRVTATPSSTATSRPITQTATPVATATLNPTKTPVPPTATAVAGTGVYPVVPPGPIAYRQRFGVAAANQDIFPALNAGIPFGSVVNWQLYATQPSPSLNAWHMVRLSQSGLRSHTSWDAIANIITEQPGAYWLIGNEMDVAVQDNVTPDQYARLYHQVYHFIKERDPSAKVVIGGVSQPTPLRMAYLDIVLNTYQQEFGTPMPIDIWNIHAFTLREEANSWGVGIPPGMGSGGAMLYEIDDHNDLTIFRQNIINFRAWMAARGYGNRPLVVTEYGILMPPDFGFPPAVVSEFMTGTFDFFLSSANGNGYPADGNRLVQWWFWYSVYDPGDFPSGNLYNRETGQITEVGQAFRGYVLGE